MILVVAWDGACSDVVLPLLDAGQLPVLASLIAKGAAREVESTVPAVTFPAWSSFLTAARPDHHGLTDFTLRDGYNVRFMNASHRRLPTMFAQLDACGLKCGSYAVPCTYPPEPIDGVVVCGFDTPLGGGRLTRRTHPPELGSRIVARYGSLAVEGPQQSRIEAGWHDRALAQMKTEIELRTDIVVDLLREGRSGRDWDLFMVHYGESDTVSHQFWQFADSDSPRYRSDGPGDAMADVYRSMDRALGRLVAALPADASLMIISDHGSGGASDRVIHWNRWLADRGLLTFATRSGSGAMRLARRAALGLVPTAMQATLFESLPGLAGRVESGHRLGGIDWSATRVFSEELNYFPALWINRCGREPQGIVGEDEVADLIAELRVQLAAFVDPFDGAPVVTRVLEREEVYDGPFSDRVPDLILELRNPDGYSYAAASSRAGGEIEPLRRLRDAEMTGARGTTMAGAHRARGLCVMYGAGVRPGLYPPGSLHDAGASVLAMAGVAVPVGADGKAWNELLEHPQGSLVPTSTPAAGEIRDYDASEAEEVARRLRALGYVE
jgi:predicted AlkP superfamily phosphohydrolase/phosphomutase